MGGCGRWGLLPASFRLLIGWLVVATGFSEPAFADGSAAAASPAITSPGIISPVATLTIHVRSVSLKGGTLRLGLYDEKGYAADAAPVASADVPATPGETVIVLKGLAPGRYAIETYEDINNNGRMDFGWLGLPLEPYGFSRDATPLLSKPRFQAAAFDLPEGDSSQSLRLQNTAPLIARR